MYATTGTCKTFETFETIETSKSFKASESPGTCGSPQAGIGYDPLKPVDPVEHKRQIDLL
ncbi:MAG: hypothetical protein ACPK85_12255 [Methanosarcina sp.]